MKQNIALVPIKENELYVDDKLLTESSVILENVGMDIQSILKVLLTRIVKEKNITFLFNQNVNITEKQPIQAEIKYDVYNTENIKMTKSKAIRLFLSKGSKVTDTITFASKNRAVANYWANPSFDVLDVDFTLILNDVVGRKLFLFIIPAYSINRSQLISRSDKPDLIDLQIMYGDETFTDNRSKYSFSKFLITELKY